MNHHHHRRRLIDLRTTTQILKQTTATIFSTRHHLLLFLLLSFLLLSLRNNVENATHSLTSFIDNDPSIKSLLSRIQIPPNHHNHPSSTAAAAATRRRRRPFLQLTRVGTLDDDFFSGDEELDHRFFGTLSTNPQLNATSFILDSFDPQLGFSSFVSDNGIRASETVRSSVKMSFRSIEVVKEEEIEVIDDGNQSSRVLIDDDGGGGIGMDGEGKTFLQLLLKRFDFDLEHHDLTALLFLVGALSSSYGFVVLAFVATHAWVHGVVFVVVVNDFLKVYAVFDRDSLGERVREGDLRFSFSWFLLDMFMSFVFAVDAWVAMVDSRKNGREVVKEGCRLLSLMVHPAINLKCLEGIVCGSFARWVLLQSLGRFFASAFQSFMEVYFMAAWLMYYFSVKSMDANASGQTFGRRELEVLLEDVR
ncbi:hypothetical protein OSB04_009563 [Centaurea solstitialis]|uniref:Uncharacterized protein n=1 Tax=Centaurea solstitialis TaxID=347529 RepID=A0AA38T7I6_9ASTR|nr:hypothetical protein OSB04_009563 [Centaurea solstitialis]